MPPISPSNLRDITHRSMAFRQTRSKQGELNKFLTKNQGKLLEVKITALETLI